MAGRKSKYTPQMHDEIIQLLKGGCLVADVCAKVGIAVSTYFEWLKKPEFSEAVDRAKGEANIHAALSIRKAMMPHDVTSRTTKTVSETRLRKVRGEHGLSEVPFEYVKTERSDTITNEFDWRAALEFLKRRDPDNWSEKLIVQIKPEWASTFDEAGVSASEVLENFVQRFAKTRTEVNNAS